MGIDNDISRSSTLLLDVKDNNGDTMNTEELISYIHNTNDGFKIIASKSDIADVKFARDVIDGLVSKGWIAPAVTSLTDIGATLISPDKKVRLNVVVAESSISFNWFSIK